MANKDVEQNSNNMLVKIEQDSASDLQALFDSVLRPTANRPLAVPYRMRKLPESFFTPPSTGSKSPSISHSRENSADSAFGSAAVGPSSGLQISHSRAHSSPASLQQTYAPGGSLPQATSQQIHHMKQRSYDIVSAAQLNEELGPLPPGWEQARTPEGQIYYLNHVTRTTTWVDPRKTLAAQAAAQHQSADTLLTVVATPQQPQSPPTPVNKPTASVTNPESLGPLPEGWEQAATAEGELYFINHQARTTSWFDPRIPQHLQRSPGASGAMLPQVWLSPLGGAQSQSSLQACQQKLRLQSLQQERERLKQRQQEIRLQELLRQQNSTELHMDPFLSGIADHTRQESADSGLGLGNTYSMPHTPEDFLSNIDDNMDCASESGAAMDATDISSLNLDSTDDLVPSLQLGEEFSSSILDDVQSLMNPVTTKPDNVLTWL